MFIESAWLLRPSSIGAESGQMPLLWSLGVLAHRNYKYAAPLALKPLKTEL